MPVVYIRRSNKKGKKWVAILPKRDYPDSPLGRSKDVFKVNTVHFGASGYEDMTQHGDILRQSRYIARHIKNEDWSDPNTAGFWSRWLLWNKPSLSASGNDIEGRFGIKVRFLLDEYFS